MFLSLMAATFENPTFRGGGTVGIGERHDDGDRSIVFEVVGAVTS